MRLVSILILIFLAVVDDARADSALTVEFGQKIAIPLKVKAESTCSIEISIRGKKDQRTIEPQGPEQTVDFEGQELGESEIRWEGKFRMRGLKSISACSSSGVIKVVTVPNSEQLKAEWARFFSSLSVDEQSCVRFGLRYKQVLFEETEARIKIESPTSPASSQVVSKCKAFLVTKTLWGESNKEDFPCTRDGEKSRCTGVYAARRADGTLFAISREEALKNQLDGLVWTTAGVETQDAKQRRDMLAAEKKEAEELVRIAKAEAAEQERIAKAKAAELERIARAERDRLAKIEQEAKEKEIQARRERERQEEEGKQKLIAENCKIATGLSVGAKEDLANALRVSVSSISLLRTSLWKTTSNKLICEAVVDTPKGTRACESEVFSDGKSTWVHFFPMLHCR
jgi:hypothetical protein